MSTYLIVAYQTAGGSPLREAIDDVMRDHPDAEFRLVVPATHTHHLFTWTEGESHAIAEETAQTAAARLTDSGVPVVGVTVGNPDPFVAVTDELKELPACEAVIVSTFPPGVSRWLRRDLPTRLERRIGLPVIHVTVEPEEDSGV